MRRYGCCFEIVVDEAENRLYYLTTLLDNLFFKAPKMLFSTPFNLIMPGVSISAIYLQNIPTLLMLIDHSLSLSSQNTIVIYQTQTFLRSVFKQTFLFVFHLASISPSSVLLRRSLFTNVVKRSLQRCWSLRLSIFLTYSSTSCCLIYISHLKIEQQTNKVRQGN